MTELSGFYEGRIYRPPSEARSLIVQSTIGCSHNRCAFCEMYREKRFRIRPLADVITDMERARPFIRHAERIFFADGDAFIRRPEEQTALMEALRRFYPECERVSMYASPRSILTRSDEELAAVRASGVALLYLGLESGDDALLQAICKGATAQEIVAAVQRARAAGFQLSVTAISGLAGAEGSAAHADATADAVSAMKPEYFSLLTLMLEPGSDMYGDYCAGRFVPLSPEAILRETRRFMERVDAEGTVFRANHASNYLNLRGTLNGDRKTMLEDIDRALAGAAPVRKESWRQL